MWVMTIAERAVLSRQVCRLLGLDNLLYISNELPLG